MALITNEQNQLTWRTGDSQDTKFGSQQQLLLQLGAAPDVVVGLAGLYEHRQGTRLSWTRLRAGALTWVILRHMQCVKLGGQMQMLDGNRMALRPM